MTPELEVKTGQPWEGYWSAVLWVDGVETTFSCNHNHKTEPAARKCIDKVKAAARLYTWSPTFESAVIDTSDKNVWSHEDDRPLVMWSRESAGVRVSCRFRLGSAKVWP